MENKKCQIKEFEMISQEVKQTPIFAEFTPEEQESFFGFSAKKVVPHIDTLYFSVFIHNDRNDCDENMQALLSRLKGLRDDKAQNYSAQIDFFGLSVENVRFSNYEFCLSCPEYYDIFLSSYLPNAQTPRAVVQLRTRSLVLNGVCQSICGSFHKLEEIFGAYDLEVERVQENRIDYAYHTNLIQNPYRYFSDDLLLEKLKSKMRLYHKVGNIGKSVDIDYLSFGQRKSNDVFVRIYNKSREVVEKNYKSFFLEKWLTDKLISRYDYYVYQKAYTMRSYVTGMLVGRIDWYLENGHDESIKEKLGKVKESCYANSDNTDRLKKVADEYLPPVTLIMNVEFQTKRKFYSSLDEWIRHYGMSYQNRFGMEEFLDPTCFPLLRLFLLYELRSEICQYLTENTLSFVEHKGTEEECLSAWWQRIHDVTIDEYGVECLKLWRSHERLTDIQKSKNRVCGTVATLAILNRKDFEKKTDFQEDISDALCVLNDNDFYGFRDNPDTGEPIDLKPKDYDVIQKRKVRQWRSILKNYKNMQGEKRK